MDIKQLRTFLHVAETGSLSTTAKRLNLSQPALSRQIRMMEEEAGIPLFARTGRGVVLSEAGERLLPRARRITEEMERLKVDMTTFAGTLSGHVRLGLPPSIGQIIGARVVERFSVTYPHVHLKVTQLLSGGLQEALLQGRMDLGVVFAGNISPTLHIEPLWEEQLYFITQPHEKWVGKRSIAFEESLKHDLILPGVRHGLRDVLEREAVKQSLKIDVLVEVESLNLQKALVCRGLGSTILSYESCRDMIDEAKLIALPLVDPAVKRTPSLVWSKDFPLSRAAQALREVVQEEAQKVASQ